MLCFMLISATLFSCEDNSVEKQDVVYDDPTDTILDLQVAMVRVGVDDNINTPTLINGSKEPWNMVLVFNKQELEQYSKIKKDNHTGNGTVYTLYLVDNKGNTIRTVQNEFVRINFQDGLASTFVPYFDVPNLYRSPVMNTNGNDPIGVPVIVDKLNRYTLVPHPDFINNKAGIKSVRVRWINWPE